MRKVEAKLKFNGGAISAFLRNRVDLQAKYNASVEVAENAIIHPEGPIRRRPGFAFIGNVKDFIDLSAASETFSRQIPYKSKTGGDSLLLFYFDATDSVICYTNSNGIPSDLSTYDIVDSGATLPTFTSADIREMQYVQIDDSIYIAHKDHPPQKITVTEDSDGDITGLTVEEFYTFPPPTQEGGYSPATTVTPGATTGTGVTFTAGASAFVAKDVGRQIVNLSAGETGRASITGYTSATQVTCDIVEDFTDTNAIASGDWKLDLSPIVEINFTADTTVTGAITNVTTTGSAAAFRSADVGSFILVHNGVLEIVSVNSSASVDCEILKSMTSDAKTFNWTLEQEEWTSTRGYPGAIAVHQDRLIFGGTDAKPNTIWMSESQLYDGFGPGSDDGDSIIIDVLSQTGGRIRWMSGGRDLSVGTDASEITVAASGGVLTPSNTEAKVRTYYGAFEDNPKTFQINNEILFIDRSGRSLRSFYYDFNIDNYKAENITFFIPHLLNTGTIKDFWHVPGPIPTIFVLTSDGRLLNGTYLPDQEIIAWGEWTFGDYSFYDPGTNTRQGYVRNLGVLQDDTGYAVLIEYNPSSTDADSDYGMMAMCKFLYSELDPASDADTLDRYWTDFSEITAPPEDAACRILAGTDPLRIFSIDTAVVAGLRAGSKVILDFSGSSSEVQALFGSGAAEYEVLSVVSTTTIDIKNASATTIVNNADVGLTANHDPDTSATYNYIDSAGSARFKWRIGAITFPESYTLDGAYTSYLKDQGGITRVIQNIGDLEFGMAYTTRIITLPFNFEGQAGPLPFEKLRPIRLYLQGHKLRPPQINGKLEETRITSDLMDSQPELLTGYLEYGPFDWTLGSKLTITSEEPNDSIILGMFISMEGNLK